MMNARGAVVVGRMIRWIVACGALALAAPLASAAPAKWVVVRGEFFDIYSNAGAGEAVENAVWLEQFRRTVSDLWKIEPKRLRRATVVHFRSTKDFEPYRPAKQIAGYMMRNDFLVAMALDGGVPDEYSRKLVQHECTHWLVASGGQGRLPLWISEGVAELYSTLELDGKRCTLFSADEYNLRWLQQTGVHSMGAVLGSSREDLDGDRPEVKREFYAQSWAAVHYLLRGQGVTDGGKKMGEYIRLQNDGVPPDAAFEKAFGFGYAALQKKISSYVNGGAYSIVRFPYSHEELRKKFKAESAPEVEIECALAGLLLGACRNPAAAALRYMQARDRWPGDPRPYEGLGCVGSFRQDPREAASQFAEAAARGSQHPQAYFLPAKSDVRGLLSGPVRSQFLAAEDERRLEAQLRRAFELDPSLDQVPDLLGRVMIFKETITADDVKFLVSLMPYAKDPDVVRYRVAGLAHRAGDRKLAREILERLLTREGKPRLVAAVEDDLRDLGRERPPERIGLRGVQELPAQFQPGGPGVKVPPPPPVRLPLSR